MSTQAALPQYQSHKKVWALQIKDVVKNENGTGLIHPVERLYAPFHVSASYMEKHDPQPGGYWVQYEDGYESWSPAEAFEKGYTRIN